MTERAKNAKPEALHRREALAFDFGGLTPLPAPVWLADKAGELGVEFDAGDVDRLGRFLAILFKGNEQLNLTAVRDADTAWQKHILDSLTLMKVLGEIPEGGSVLDVGTGGGLPGIPLAICRPDLKFTLMEATGKKAAYLEAATAALGLANVRTVCGRAEEVAHDRGTRGQGGRAGGHRERYDAVIARAVGRLKILAELTVPFAKIGGLVALIKGAKAEEELAEAKESLHQLHAMALPVEQTPSGRLVILTKQSATPKPYPRRSGELTRSAPSHKRKPRGREKPR
jgi:16S rRNA (guanine527-N7)-methyltransferase